MSVAKHPQLELDLRTWGGKRKGAGRPKQNAHDSPHVPRPQHVGRYPLHIVLRTVRDVPRLRCEEAFEATRKTLAKIGERLDFRIVHLSLQHNHVHLLVEANDSVALESGMRALTISLARQLNRAFGRTGQVFAVRYHATTLRSPTQVRNAISYVLNNWRRHNEDERELRARFWILDRYSSAIRFAGWADWQGFKCPDGYTPLPVASPQTWFLAEGWQRARKPIRTSEVPGPLR